MSTATVVSNASPSIFCESAARTLASACPLVSPKHNRFLFNSYNNDQFYTVATSEPELYVDPARMLVNDSPAVIALYNDSHEWEYVPGFNSVAQADEYLNANCEDLEAFNCAVIVQL